MKEIDKEILLEELKNNPKCAAYLSKFSNDSASEFLGYYVSKKMIFLSYGKFMRDRQDSNEVYFRETAKKFYWQIAQKKLFNLQCRWRARQVDLPVEASVEFSYWERNIESCPFNDPVTEHDVEVMLKFLSRPYKDVVESWWEAWQDYDDFKNGGYFENEYPDWYEFYDNHMGTHFFHTLPNIRGAEEERYLTAWRSEQQVGDREAPIPDKPFLHYNSESTMAFIKAVEPYKVLDLYRIYEEYEREEDASSSLNDVLDTLSKEEEEVMIPSGPFPTAIYEAEYLLQARKMERLLPLISQEIKEMRAMGITHRQDCALEEDNIVTMVREGIKRGKQLLGEE